MINASIVLYNPDWTQVAKLTQSLLQNQCVRNVFWVDNSPCQTEELPISSKKVQYIYDGKNLGYGAAHNIAIRESIYDDVPFHLIVNPDIIITPNTLPELLNFIQSHREVGMVMPKVVYPNGELQYLCK